MSSIVQDLRCGFRALVKTPGVTAAAILSLAIGVGANTSIFSVVNAVLLRPLPFQDPQQLVAVNWAERSQGGETQAIPVWSYPKFTALRERSRTFQQVAGYCRLSLPLTEAGNPEKVDVEIVSASYLPALRVDAFRGRGFMPEEDSTPGAHPVALVSYALWQRRFGSDPKLIGRNLSISNVPLTIVGILPPGFRGLSGTAEVWTPMMMAPDVMRFPDRLKQAGTHWLQVVARIKPEFTFEQARAEARIAGDAAARDWAVRIERLSDANIDRSLRTSLLILLAAVGFVLLIACANIANLLLAKAAAREKEIAIRLALGAGRGRLMRQLLIESLVLACLGGFAGLLLALWGIDTLSAFKPGNPLVFGSRQIEVPGFNPIRLDWSVLGFNLFISLATGILFGLLPAFRASRPDLCQALKEGVSGWVQGFRRRERLSPGTLLVMGEIAIAFMLLTGAGLMIRSFANLRWQRLGFEPENLLTLNVELPMALSPTARAAFYGQLLARASALPGVQSAGLASVTPLMDPVDNTVMRTVAPSGARGTQTYGISVHGASTGLFRTLGVPLLKGRLLADSDAANAPPVAVINETAARSFWPGEDPVGKRMSVDLWDEKHPPVEVVGVVGDVKYGKIDEAVSPAIYMSYRQYTWCGYLILRTAAAPASLAPAIRREVLALDRKVPINDVMTMEQRIAASTTRTRFSAVLLSIFGAMALALSVVGVYGVMSYAVARRGREIGIRVALGARERDVLRSVMTGAFSLTLTGLGIGAAAALAITRVLSAQLYGISATDPATLGAVATLLAGTALTASYVPARRAMKVSALDALRHE